MGIKVSLVLYIFVKCQFYENSFGFNVVNSLQSEMGRQYLLRLKFWYRQYIINQDSTAK